MKMACSMFTAEDGASHSQSGPTYSCESVFSTMTVLKNQYHSGLPNECLHQSVCLAITTHSKVQSLGNRHKMSFLSLSSV